MFTIPSFDDLKSQLSLYFSEINLTAVVYSYLPKEFISVWHVNSNNKKIILPFDSIHSHLDYSLDFLLEWGDGSLVERVTFHSLSMQKQLPNHIYPNSGDYIIRMYGNISNFSFNQSSHSRQQLMEIRQWGGIRLSDRGHQFHGCVNMNITALDAPRLGTLINTYLYIIVLFIHLSLTHTHTYVYYMLTCILVCMYVCMYACTRPSHQS